MVGEARNLCDTGACVTFVSFHSVHSANANDYLLTFCAVTLNFPYYFRFHVWMKMLCILCVIMSNSGYIALNEWQ